MDKYDVFDTAKRYAIELTQSDQFVKITELKKKIDVDFKELLDEFSALKVKFIETSKYGEYDLDFKKIKKQFQEVKQKLYSEPLIKEYFRLEREMQETLNEVASKLASSISSKFKEQECSKTCYKENQ